jgi:WD40 repeat protein
MRFSPDGKWLATTTLKGVVKLWNLTTGKETHALINGKSWSRPIVFTPDSTRVAFISSDDQKAGRPMELIIWSVRTGKLLRRINCTTERARAVAFSPDGKVLAAGGKRIRLWDPSTGKALRTLDLPAGTEAIHRLVFSADRKRLAALSTFIEGGSIHIYEIDKVARPVSLTAFKPQVLRAWFRRDGKRLESLHRDGKRRCWDVLTGKLLATQHAARLPRSEPVYCPFSADGRLLAFFDERIILRETLTGKELWSVPPRYAAARTGLPIEFSPDGRWLATAPDDWAVEVWDLRAILKGRR